MASNTASLTKVSISSGKWFVGWFTAFGILYMMAEVPSMSDLAATLAIGIVIGTAFVPVQASTANGTTGPVQGPDIGMTPAQIAAANAAARARIGG